MEKTSYIAKVIEGQGFYSYTPFENTGIIEKKHITEVTVTITDGRRISPAQQRKIFALVTDITAYISAPSGNQWGREYEVILRELRVQHMIDHSDSEHVRRILTMRYCDLRDIAPISLANVDMSTASEFIDWLVELCVIHNIPCVDTLLLRCEDVTRYLYACMANRRCALCGADADVHHYDRIGRGRNRKEIVHLGYRVQPLCRIHHKECHDMGQLSFDKLYNITWVTLDDNLCDILKLKKE